MSLVDVLACVDGADAADDAGCAAGFAAAGSWLPKFLDMIEPNMLIDNLLWVGRN